MTVTTNPAITGASSGSMTYPGAGVPQSTGSAWGTSITPGTGVVTALAANTNSAGGVVVTDGSNALPALNGAALTGISGGLTDGGVVTVGSTLTNTVKNKLLHHTGSAGTITISPASTGGWVASDSFIIATESATFPTIAPGAGVTLDAPQGLVGLANPGLIQCLCLSADHWIVEVSGGTISAGVTISGTQTAGELYKNNTTDTLVPAVIGQDYAAPPVINTAIPLILPPTGTIDNTSGSITLGTALNNTYTSAYMAFDLGQLYTNSPAGWYYFVGSSTTAGVVYSDTYSGVGNPTIPASPTPLTTVAGAFTGTTAEWTEHTITIPAGYMGSNGKVTWDRTPTFNNTANNKTSRIRVNGTIVHALQSASTAYAWMQGVWQNIKPNVQTTIGRTGATSASQGVYTIDTASAVTVTVTMQKATATDYVVEQAHTITVSK